MFPTDSSTRNFYNSENYKRHSEGFYNTSNENPFLKSKTTSNFQHKIIKPSRTKTVKISNHLLLSNPNMNHISNTIRRANLNILYNKDNNCAIEEQIETSSIYSQYKDSKQMEKKICNFKNNININKKYKNIQEVSDDQDFFHLLYLSFNLNGSKEKSINQENKQNFLYVKNDDKKIIKYTELFFQKVEKAINLFNSSLYEKAYESLKEDKIICNISEFVLFLILTPGIDSEIFYKYLSVPINSNQDFQACKIFFNFFDYSLRTVLHSTLFLLKILNIEYINSNNNVVDYFSDAFIRDNMELLDKNPNLKKDVKSLMNIVINLNYTILLTNNQKKKPREYFISKNVCYLNCNQNIKELVCNDKNQITKLKTKQHILGYIYDEYIKNQNISEKEQNEIKKDALVSNSIDFNQQRKRGATISYSSFQKDNKSTFNVELQRLIFYNDVHKNIKTMKLGGFFQKVYNEKEDTVKCFLNLSKSEKYINVKLFSCCWNSDKIYLEEINSRDMEYSQDFYTFQNLGYCFTITLNNNKYYKFYNINGEYIKNWINGIKFLTKFNKIKLPTLSKLKIKKEKISVIWQKEILPNWNKYRKYILIENIHTGDKNNKLNRSIDLDNVITTLQSNNEEIITLWKLGLPSWLRQNMWKIIIGNKLLITENLFQGYMKIIPPEYKNYIKENNNILLSSNITDRYIIKEIVVDIHKYYNRHTEIIINTKKNKFQEEIFVIIRCFCYFRPDILYTKEILELSSLFYLNTDNFFNGFKLLCNFAIPSYLFHFIQKDIVYMKNFIDFFELLLKKYSLILYKYFERVNFKNCTYFYKWAKYLYLKNLDYNLCLRIFDNFLIKGKIFVFQVALAILLIKQEELLNSSYSNLVLILKKKQIDIDEDRLFEQIEKIDIIAEYTEFFNMYTLGKEKLELMQDL